MPHAAQAKANSQSILSGFQLFANEGDRQREVESRQGMDGSPQILGRGMIMGLFNNEIEKKAGPDPSVVVPQSLPAQAVPVPPPTRPDASRVAMPHQGIHAQTVGARAYLDQGSKISGKLKFEGPVGDRRTGRRRDQRER